MDRFFSIFGKLALILLFIGILLTGGYYFGTGKLPFPTGPAPAAVTTTAPESSAPSTITTTAPNSPTPTINLQQVTVTGLSGTSFGGFTMNVPESWTVKKEGTPNVSQKITVSRGAYSINFYQAATGGAQCVYPGDAVAEMSTSFGPFVTLHDGAGNEYRRATATGSTNGFTVCQKGDAAFFGLPTSFGHTSYTAPANPDPAILQEMDAIFATLKKT